MADGLETTGGRVYRHVLLTRTQETRDVLHVQKIPFLPLLARLLLLAVAMPGGLETTALYAQIAWQASTSRPRGVLFVRIAQQIPCPQSPAQSSLRALATLGLSQTTGPCALPVWQASTVDLQGVPFVTIARRIRFLRFPAQSSAPAVAKPGGPATTALHAQVVRKIHTSH